MIDNLMLDTDISSINKTPLSGRYIYFIVNSDDDVIYVGQTCSPAFRLTSHKGNDQFDFVKMVKVNDNIDLCDVEFMEVLKYKPAHNREFPTPTFLTTKTRIVSDGLEHLYDLNSPDIKLKLHEKTRLFWVKHLKKLDDKFMRLITKIINTEKQHDKQNDLIVDEIDKLESKVSIRLTSDCPVLSEALNNTYNKLEVK